MKRALATVLWLSLAACGGDGDAGLGGDAAVDGSQATDDAAGVAGDADAPSDAAAAGDAVGPDAVVEESDAGGIDVSFARDIAPVLEASCTYCHHASSATGVDLTSPFHPSRGVVSRPSRHAGARSPVLVDPGNPEGSFLLDKLRASDLDPPTEGAPMPWQVPRLDAAQIADVRQWIGDGARLDDFYLERVETIFGVAGALPGDGGGRCSYCHYPGTPTPPDLTRPFDPDTGVVGVMGSAGGVRVVPGDPDASLLVRKVEGTLGVQMPFWPPAPSAAAVDAIEDWIRAGAPDN